MWIDIGALVDGYRSDLTRTFCLGESDTRYREVYDLVLRAQLAAERGAAAGRDRQGRGRRRPGPHHQERYGESFRHGTGHGVGLAIHELPNLGLRAGRTPLAPGNVVTVEPGIYLDGWGGVRIEDLAVVTGILGAAFCQCHRSEAWRRAYLSRHNNTISHLSKEGKTYDFQLAN